MSPSSSSKSSPAKSPKPLIRSMKALRREERLTWVFLIGFTALWTLPWLGAYASGLLGIGEVAAETAAAPEPEFSFKPWPGLLETPASAETESSVETEVKP